MLASTMHISTNNQPTPTANTHTRKTRQFALKSVIGAEATSSACSFRTQQGAKQSRQPHRSPFHARSEDPRPTRVNCSRCRRNLPSVSAIEP
jgi:hypothetical protein